MYGRYVHVYVCGVIMSVFTSATTIISRSIGVCRCLSVSVNVCVYVHQRETRCAARLQICAWKYYDTVHVSVRLWLPVCVSVGMSMCAWVWGGLGGWAKGCVYVFQCVNVPVTVYVRMI